MALEPEAASLCCRDVRLLLASKTNLSLLQHEQAANGRNFEPGTRFVVVDAGGGTVDITVHQVRDATTVAEVCAPSG